jgi:phosphatidylserine/phosphatidylglycerophosphate/cardiolipin synthase-like enzyme
LTGRRVRDAAIGLAILALMAVLLVRFRDSAMPASPITTEPGGAAAIGVYFTQPAASQTLSDPAALVALLQAVAELDRTIDVAAYDLQLPEIGEALSQARQRGVRIRLATESRHLQEPVVQRLEGEGIGVIGDRRDPLMHHKFMIIGGREVWTGSMNFTYNGVYHNDNALIIIDSQKVAEDSNVNLTRCTLKTGLGRCHWPIRPTRMC